MNYWHLQMNQPWGRNSVYIKSQEMLMETPSVIGTGDWDDDQYRNFVDENGNGVKNNDIVLVREGSTPIALCRVSGPNFKNQELQTKYHHQNFRVVDVLSYYDSEAKVILNKSLSLYKTSYIQAVGTLNICKNNNATKNFISEWFKYLKIKRDMDKLHRLLEYKKQIILQGPPGTGKTRRAELIAKEILDVSDIAQLQDHEQYKIVQFHPSYTYEDFVRGIVAEANGDRIEYKNVNKTISKFAKVALDNFLDSKKDIVELSLEKWIEDEFNLFIDKISETLEQDKISLSDNVDLVDLMDDAFLYIGENWKGYEHRMSFKDIKRAYLDNNITRQDIVKNLNLSGSARQHATYYIVVLKKFREFLGGKAIPTNQTEIKEKKYILVIDEINRANLSTVLGELIYALEYRGKGLDSIYEVEGEQKILLPENLYIIGTMNTADRSVGHIDYAIRRRFAFVDVLPVNLESELKDDFKTDIFSKVTSLFIENYDSSIDYSDENVVMKKSEYMTADFGPKDVWLGHSYFIQHYEKNEKGEDVKEKPVEFSFRIKYEIKPILEEYIKDGILKESARSVINSL